MSPHSTCSGTSEPGACCPSFGLAHPSLPIWSNSGRFSVGLDPGNVSLVVSTSTSISKMTYWHGRPQPRAPATLQPNVQTCNRSDDKPRRRRPLCVAARRYLPMIRWSLGLPAFLKAPLPCIWVLVLLSRGVGNVPEMEKSVSY